jgi:hypothetical protein
MDLQSKITTEKKRRFFPIKKLTEKKRRFFPVKNEEDIMSEIVPQKSVALSLTIRLQYVEIIVYEYFRQKKGRFC